MRVAGSARKGGRVPALRVKAGVLMEGGTVNPVPLKTQCKLHKTSLYMDSEKMKISTRNEANGLSRQQAKEIRLRVGRK
jgi:hypothetical protein